ncbi:MAG: hypothetical protein AAB836_01215 [Patescibacteria group bacterium]
MNKINIPERMHLEKIKAIKFGFVNNEILRENLAIKMQNIMFLDDLSEHFELPGSVSYPTYKTIIIYTASIVESLINYKLHELIKSGKINPREIMGKEEKFPICKQIYRLSETEEICGVKKVTELKKLNDATNFIELNRIAKRCGLFTKDLFTKAEEIRYARNRIHVFSLQEIDDKYTKADINDIFLAAGEITERIKFYK